MITASLKQARAAQKSRWSSDRPEWSAYLATSSARVQKPGWSVMCWATGTADLRVSPASVQ